MEWQDTIGHIVQDRPRRRGTDTVSRRRAITESPGLSRKADAERDFGRQVRTIVARLLPEGPPDIRAIAAAMRTSARTLQRRLHGAGLTYAGLVQDARREAASRLLATSDQTVGDVARLLGYSDPAHFARAFQRWTGLTPREFRRREHGANGVGSPASPRPRRSLTE